jgi:hypothetical protein
MYTIKYRCKQLAYLTVFSVEGGLLNFPLFRFFDLLRMTLWLLLDPKLRKKRSIDWHLRFKSYILTNWQCISRKASFFCSNPDSPHSSANNTLKWSCVLHSTAVDKDIASSIDKVNRDIESTTASLSDIFLMPLASSINCLSILTERDDLVFCEPSILMKSDLIHSKSLISLFPLMGIVEETAGNSIPASCKEDVV